MEAIEFTSLSSKGQIVIPQDIRKQLQLVPGEKFVITGHGDTIVLKKVNVQSIDGLDDLLKRTRAFAKASNITPKDVRDAIKRVRQNSRRP